MTIDDILPRVIELLERQGWASYRLLQRRFRLDEKTLKAITTELIVDQGLAQEAENGDKLIWLGELRPRATSAWPAIDEGSSSPSILPPETEKSIPVSPSRHRLTSLVGRESEMALLLTDWARVEAGQGQVVWLHGEAGIGKSRLVQQLMAHVADRPAWVWACRSATEFQLSAFYPIIDLLQHKFDFKPDDPPLVKQSKLEAGLLSYGITRPEIVPPLAGWLSIPLGDRYAPLTLPADQQRGRIMAAVVELLGAVARMQPVLLIVEDLHWSDASTLEWLERLVEQVENLGVYVLLTSRPEFEASWLESVHLPLGRLDRSQVEIVDHGDDRG